jgi:hypothetical protein
VERNVNVWDPIDVERAKVFVAAKNHMCGICGEVLELQPATRERDALRGMIRIVGHCEQCGQDPEVFYVKQE